MATAPTLPTKPTPPVAPTLTPAGGQSSSEQPPAATQAPAVSGQSQGQPVSPEVSGAVKHIEEIRKAFEGLPAKPKAAEQAKPAEIGDKTKPNTSQPLPATVGNSQNVVSSQTAVPPPPIVSKSKLSITTYIPFFIGVVVLVAVVLTAMRLFNPKSGKANQPDANLDVAKEPAAAIDDITKIIIAPPSPAPKSDSNFEAKV